MMKLGRRAGENRQKMGGWYDPVAQSLKFWFQLSELDIYYCSSFVLLSDGISVVSF